MALIVVQRRREIGVRIALGAHPSRAVVLILKDGMKWTSTGLCVGVLGALAISVWLSSNFHDLNFFDPVAFAGMALVIAATAGAACYIPARRASRVDPMMVLRED
jgi:ABC-type antimicrobial peptide transport system permease subunit